MQATTKATPVCVWTSPAHLAEHGCSTLQERLPAQAVVCRQAQLVHRQQHARMLRWLLCRWEDVAQQALRQEGGAIRGATAGAARSCPALQLKLYHCSQAARWQVGRVLLQQAGQQHIACSRRAAATACRSCCCLFAGGATAALRGRSSCRLLLRCLRQFGLQAHKGLHQWPPRSWLCSAKVQQKRQAEPQAAQRFGCVACLLLRARQRHTLAAELGQPSFQPSFCLLQGNGGNCGVTTRRSACQAAHARQRHAQQAPANAPGPQRCHPSAAPAAPRQSPPAQRASQRRRLHGALRR